MKALFLAVCLLNIVFFFWEYHKGALNAPPQPLTGLPQIRLAEAKDLPAFHIPEPAENPAPPPAVAASGNTAEPSAKAQAGAFRLPEPPCYEIGPFTDHQAAISWLAAQVFSGEMFEKEAQAPSSFVVYFPGKKDPEQLRNQKQLLNAKGISDIWQVPSGDLKGMLSLGVFNDLARANTFKTELAQRYGVQAEIKERRKNQSRLFVRFKTDQKIENVATDMKPEKCKGEIIRPEAYGVNSPLQNKR